MEDVHTETCTISPMGTFSSGGRIMNMDQQKAVKKEDSEDEDHVCKTPVHTAVQLRAHSDLPVFLELISDRTTFISHAHFSSFYLVNSPVFSPSTVSSGETSHSVTHVSLVGQLDEELLKPVKDEEKEEGSDDYFCKFGVSIPLI